MTILLCLLAAMTHAAAVERPAAPVAIHALKAAFDPAAAAPLGAETAPLLAYFSADAPAAQAGAADPVVAELRAEAAQFLTGRMPVDAKERAAWQQRMMLLQRLNANLEEADRAKAAEHVANMSRFRRAEIQAIIGQTVSDWTRGHLGDEEAFAAEESAPAAAPKTNVLEFKLKKRATPPERKLQAPAVVAQTDPDLMNLTSSAKKLRDALGWEGMAISEHDLDAVDAPLKDGDRSVKVHYFGNAAMVVSVSGKEAYAGFAKDVTWEQRNALRKAGIDFEEDYKNQKRLKLKGLGWLERRGA